MLSIGSQRSGLTIEHYTTDFTIEKWHLQLEWWLTIEHHTVNFEIMHAI